MSLSPYLFDDSYFMRPSRLLDQHFGLTLEPKDLLQPFNVPKMRLHYPPGYIRNWKSAASEQDSADYTQIQFMLKQLEEESELSSSCLSETNKKTENLKTKIRKRFRKHEEDFLFSDSDIDEDVLDIPNPPTFKPDKGSSSRSPDNEGESKKEYATNSFSDRSNSKGGVHDCQCVKVVGSTVNFGQDQFVANLDVQQFKPNEITVKVTGENTITIEGKHEEKEDEHGRIYRHFVRRYTIPKNYDINKIQSKLSSDGVLSICAPKIDSEQVEPKNIQIQQTGEPAKIQEKKADGDKKDTMKQ